MAAAAAKGCFPPLCRCFRAWQRLAQRGAQYRGHLAHRRLRTLRVCLAWWMEMKQLRASDVTRVTRFALYWQKAGEPVANTGSLLSNQSPMKLGGEREYYSGRELC